MDNTVLGLLALLQVPQVPSKWNIAYRNTIIDRCNKRIQNLRDRVDGIPQGKSWPDFDQVAIGSGKHHYLAVLFLDICGFSSWPSSNHEQQRTVLKILNVFMAEMMNIVRDFGGYFEKNTGDGVMAYFGADKVEHRAAIQAAVEAAVVMHYVNDNVISPWLLQQGVQAIHFRIGIDCGEVTIGRVGVPGGLSSFVAIGTTANIACKIMRLIPDGGICVGELVFQGLPHNWNRSCTRLATPTGFVYVGTQAPYPAFNLTYRLTHPT